MKPEMLGLDGRVGLDDSAHPTTATATTTVMLTLFALLLTASRAHAHRLHADYYVLSDRQVRIESYFDDDKRPQGATVEVRHADGRLLTEGKSDANGHFVFRFDTAETLAVTINAGVGHRKEFVIPQEHLEPVTTTSPTDSAAPAVQGPFPGRETHDPLREQIKDALVGISFLLSVAAFLLSWRTNRRLRQNEKQP